MAEYIVKANKDGNISFTSSGVKIYEEVIRCRDCKKRNELPEGIRCQHPRFKVKDKYGNVYEPLVHPNGFCAWAERDDHE